MNQKQYLDNIILAMCHREQPQPMELDDLKLHAGVIGGFVLLWADHVYDASIHQHEGLDPDRMGGYCMTIADSVKCEGIYPVTTSSDTKTLSWYPEAANGIVNNEDIVITTILGWFTLFGKQMFDCSCIGGLKVLVTLQPWGDDIFSGVTRIENRASTRAIHISPFPMIIDGCKRCVFAGVVVKCLCFNINQNKHCD